MSSIHSADKVEALERARQMFNKLDVDNPNHSCVLIMYDHEAESFRMVAVNSDTTMALALMAMAAQALTSTAEAEHLREEGKLN